MVKKVEYSKAILAKYTDKELINFISESLRTVVTAEQQLDNGLSAETKYGALLVNLDFFSRLLSAVNKRMNDIDDDPKIVI